MAVENCCFCNKWIDLDYHEDVYCDVCGQCACESCQEIHDLDDEGRPLPESILRCPECVGRGRYQ